MRKLTVLLACLALALPAVGQFQVRAGTTDYSTVIRIVDSTTFAPETAVEHDTPGIDLEYRREGEAVVDITETALSALTDAHSDGGIEPIGNGYYRLDLPDAAVAEGATGVLVQGTVTGMIVIGAYIELVDYDPHDSVRMGLTALPNAAADAAGGLPISYAGALDLDAQIGTDIDAILADTGTDGVRVSDGTGAGQIALTNGAIDHVTLVDTTTTNTDMRGTDNASTLDAAGVRNAVGLASANLDTQLDAIPTVGEIDTELTSSHGSGAWTSGVAGSGDATEAKQDAILASLAAAKGATFDTATDSLEAIRDRGDTAWLSGAGEGAITYEYTLTSSVDATPIDDALVEVYTEVGMTNKVAQGRTDAFGKVTFYLDAGTYYFRQSKSGWTFTNPKAETVE